MSPDRCVSRFLLCLLILLGAGLGGCSNGSGGSSSSNSTPGPLTPDDSREFRAITGVSMGAYGALNLGTKRSDLFGVIGSLGGPIDMDELIRHIGNILEVKTLTQAPFGPGADYTFDHMPPYPDRDTAIEMIQDLCIALGNPFLHHTDPNFQYLASHSQPAQLGFRIDDQFGALVLPLDPRGFLDGGDTNEDGRRQIGESVTRRSDVLLTAQMTLGLIAPGSMPVLNGERELADTNGDGIYDVGDGLVLNFSEPFTDLNGNFIFEPALGETASDFGLDGVPGNNDFGESNGVFDYDPDRPRWFIEDPTARLRNRDAADILTQRIYMDVGIDDEFNLAQHYDNLVAVLQGKGLTVAEQTGFSGDCVSVPSPQDQFLLVKYNGGHIGIPSVDDILNDLLFLDFCGNSSVIWQRVLTLVGYLEESFVGGFYGFGGATVVGDMSAFDISSPALALTSLPTPTREVYVYRPPAFFNTAERFPVVYFLGGYGMKPEDMVRMGELLDVLIASGQIQNMVWAFLPGDGGVQGSFYLNQAVPEVQVPGIANPTTGRYEDSILEDLIPAIESNILSNRVKGG